MVTILVDHDHRELARALVARGLLGLLGLLAGCACTPAPPPSADATIATFAAAPVRDHPLDWNAVDRAMPREWLVRYNHLFGDVGGDANRLARLDIGHPAPADSLGHREFMALPLAVQKARRARADGLVRQATVAVLAPARRIARNPWPLTAGGVAFAATPGLEATLARALAALHTAVGCDPENVDAWHDLAYFSAIIGDQPTASHARREFLELSLGVDQDQRDRRCRAALDEAWFLRDHGYHDRCRLWLMGHGRLIDSSGRLPDGLPPRIEHDLILGLLAAEDGDVLEARRRVRRLPLVPVRDGPGHRLSEYLRSWVRVWTRLHDDDPDAVAFLLSAGHAGPLDAGVGWRFWQDMGHASEAIGDDELAERFWRRATSLRPFLGFYPQATLRAPDTARGREETGGLFVTAYRTHHTGGSLWAFAVSRVLLCQTHDPASRPLLWREARLALDRCVRRGIRPGEADRLRARLQPRGRRPPDPR